MGKDGIMVAVAFALFAGLLGSSAGTRVAERERYKAGLHRSHWSEVHWHREKCPAGCRHQFPHDTQVERPEDCHGCQEGLAAYDTRIAREGR